MLFQVYSPITLGPKSSYEHQKGHQLERMTVLQRREYKKIRGKEGIMAIVVAVPRTVDDGDMTELYALENHF